MTAHSSVAAAFLHLENSDLDPVATSLFGLATDGSKSDADFWNALVDGNAELQAGALEWCCRPTLTALERMIVQTQPGSFESHLAKFRELVEKMKRIHTNLQVWNG